jgi:DNA repair protein RecN (Recombination protein N)
VEVLDGDPRVTEIARMLGGDPESDVSRAHARELLDAASASFTAERPESPAGRGRSSARGRRSPPTSRGG